MKSFLLLIVMVSFISCDSLRYKDLKSISVLPTLSMLRADSTYFTTGRTEEKPVVMIYFRPDCIHCKAELKMILDNIKSLDQVQFYLFTSASLENVKAFYISFNLRKYRNIFMGKDYELAFVNAYHPHQVPYMAIYSQKKQLLRIYTGEVEANSLIALVRA